MLNTSDPQMPQSFKLGKEQHGNAAVLVWSTPECRVGGYTWYYLLRYWPATKSGMLLLSHTIAVT